MTNIPIGQKRIDSFSPIRLSNMIHGMFYTQLIFVAAKLNLADLLKDGGKPIKELALATGTLELRLYRMMRALASVGIFTESKPKYFELTPLAELLQSGSPGSQKNLAIKMGSKWYLHAWANILHSVQQEKSAFDDNADLFEYLQNHPADAAVFNHAMTFTSQMQAAAICHAYDFSGVKTIVDIAGGYGFLLSVILKAHPTLKGMIFDKPYVIKTVRARFKADGLDQRCRIIEGDFFDSIPEGSDVYILKHVIHNWDDAHAVTILKNCRKAMKANSRILVIDAIIPVKNPSFKEIWSDIEMMVMLSNGRERTKSEFKNLFDQAGFKLNKIIPTSSELSIIEGIRLK